MQNATDYPNRAARRAAGLRGTHRAGTEGGLRRTFATGVMVLATTGLVAGIAHAAPQINPAPPSASNPAPTTVNPSAPAIPEAPPVYEGPGVIPDPPSTLWQTNPNTPNAPVYWGPPAGGYQAPTILDTVFTKPAPPMILPEPGVIRVGDLQGPKAPWITMAEMNSINRWSAYIESRIAQFWMTQINPATGKPFTETEAQRRAATMLVGGAAGGAIGGAAGAAAGFVPGAVIGGVAGAGVGAVAGLGIGFVVGLATGIPLLPVGPLWITQGAAGALIGLPIGIAVGAAGGAALGGLVGATVVGIPAAALGVGLGTLFGGGDPNQDITQPWTYRNGQGEIEPKDNALEFDWNGTAAVPALAGVPDSHVNLQVKDDDTWVVNFGGERWIGATQEQRDQYFYGEIDDALPGVNAGQALRGVLEDKSGVFQTTIKDFLAGVAKDDPKNAQYNPDGDVADPSRKAEPVHYGYTSTPRQWEEPRYLDADDPRAEGGSEDAGVTEAPPVNDQGMATAASAPATTASYEASAPSYGSADSTPAPAPAPAPAPVVQTGNQVVDDAAANVQNQLAALLPGQVARAS